MSRHVAHPVLAASVFDVSGAGGGVMGAASSRRDLVPILNLPIWDDHRFVAKFIHGGQQLDRDMNRDKTGLRHQERKKPAIF